MIMTFIQKDSKLDYEDNVVSPLLKAQSNSDASEYVIDSSYSSKYFPL